MNTFIRFAAAAALALASIGTLHAESEGSKYLGNWEFEKNANDSSDAGNNGTAQRVRYTTGISGHGARLYGNGSITVPYDDSMSASNGLMIELYYKVLERGITGTLVSRGDLTQQTGAWALGLIDGDLVFQYLGQDGAVQKVTLGSEALPVDAWVHVTAVASLVDGYMGFSTDYGSTWDYSLEVTTMSQVTDDLVIGQSFLGWIDEVEVTKPWY